MAPILIDGRDLVKLGFISMLVSLLVFVTGFFSGYQQATTFLSAGSETESLLLPEKVAAAVSEIEPQRPEIIVAGANLDVDQPEEITEAVATPEKVEVVNNVQILQKAINNETVSAEIKPALENRKTQTGMAVLEEVNTDKKLLVIAELSSDELEKIKYSIQVGMYGRLVNAENMMKLLRERQWDAYVSDFSNNKNEVRYNVRFGYYMDKKSAIAALKDYKKTQNGDGYLVKFSVESITDLARAGDARRVKPDVTLEKKVSPAAVSTDAVSS